MKKEEVTIRAGMEFTSIHFAATVEVKAIRPEMNEVDVIITTTEGHGREEKAWNLQHLKWGFEKEEYMQLSKEPQFGVI